MLVFQGYHNKVSQTRAKWLEQQKFNFSKFWRLKVWDQDQDVSKVGFFWSLSLWFIDCWRQWHPTTVLLPGKSHGRRSLEGCSPWGHWGSDTTERLHFHFSLWCIGEGNGTPLQCSCLENPRAGGAWWAAVYGVAQSRTWLKWLSSSSSSHLLCLQIDFPPSVSLSPLRVRTPIFWIRAHHKDCISTKLSLEDPASICTQILMY